MLGSFASAAFIGALLGGSGWLLGHITGFKVGSTIALLAYGAWVSAAAFGWVPQPPRGISRQTNPVWFRRFGPVRASAMWGLDLGSMLSTQPTARIERALPLAVFWLGDATVGSVAFLTWATLRMIPIVLGPLLPEPKWSILRLRRLLVPIDAAAGAILVGLIVVRLA